MGQNCRACHQGSKACPNFATWVTPEVCCDRCHVTFYGQNVLRHISKNCEVGKVFVNGSVNVWNVVRSTRSKARRNIAAINPDVPTAKKSPM